MMYLKCHFPPHIMTDVLFYYYCSCRIDSSVHNNRNSALILNIWCTYCRRVFSAITVERLLHICWINEHKHRYLKNPSFTLIEILLYMTNSLCGSYYIQCPQDVSTPCDWKRSQLCSVFYALPSHTLVCRLNKDGKADCLNKEFITRTDTDVTPECVVMLNSEKK